MRESYRIRIDPWEPEYESAIQIGTGEEEIADVDIGVELGVRTAVEPAPVEPPAKPLFVDSVRRIDRILLEGEDRTLFGPLHVAYKSSVSPRFC